MQDFLTIQSAIDSLIVFILLSVLAVYIINRYFDKKKRGLFIYLWHTLFTLIYVAYLSKYGGDAAGYYYSDPQSLHRPSLATEGVTFITAIFSHLIKLSFIGTSLIFGFFGFIGLIAFDISIRSIDIGKSGFAKKIAVYITFLPSISFWSSGIGKDSLAFMSIGLTLWACLKLKERFFILVFAILLMFFVRPHIGGVMLLSYIIHLFFEKHNSIGKKIFLFIFFLIPASAAIPFALNYAGLGEASSASEVSEYFETRQSYNQEGGGGIDISSMPLPLQIFTFLFRPLPFEATSFAALAASIDNIILLILSISTIRHLILRKSKGIINEKFFLIIYSISTLVILSATTANLGISIRQKWMVTPVIIFILLSFIKKQTNR